MKRGDRVYVCGDTADLWIEGYNVRVSTNAIVEETPKKNAKKVLLTLDWIDGEGNVCCMVRRSKVRPLTMELNIREIAYELYKQDWIDSNTTAEMRLTALREYVKYKMECVENNEEIETFDEWVWDRGYGGGCMYVCFEEFCDEEYHDKEYMETLLADAELIKLYYRDIG